MSTSSAATAFTDHAADLATWAVDRLVNRRDVFGSYLPSHQRTTKRRKNGTTFTDRSRTAPPTKMRGRVVLTGDVLIRHFAGLDVGHVIGLHALSQDQRCKWIAVDIDCHGDGADPAVNLRFALYLFNVLVSLGFTPLLIDSDGKGGFHIWILFRDPVAGEVAYPFAKWMVRDHKAHGIAKVETYPKQPSATCGNWLRLPGRHHTSDHWSKVWDGSKWLDGADAVAFVLAIDGNDPALIPSDSTSPPAQPAKPAVVRPAPVVKGSGLMTPREVALLCTTYLSADRADDYEKWINVGIALHSVDSGAEMLAAWDIFSRRSGKYVEGECAAKWRTFSNSATLGIGWLVTRAREDGFEPFPVRSDDDGPIGTALQHEARRRAERQGRNKPSRGFRFTYDPDEEEICAGGVA